MKTFQLSAEPRTDLGKKAAKALRKENKIPVVLNGGEVIDLPYKGKLRDGEKIVVIEKDQSKGLITTDLVVTNDSVRKLIYTPDIFAIELSLHGEKRMAVLKDIQFPPRQGHNPPHRSSRSQRQEARGDRSARAA